MGCTSAKGSGDGAGIDYGDDEKIMRPSVDKLLECAKIAEPLVTTVLRTVEAEFKGELCGLDHKFKSEASLMEKVHKEIARKRVEASNAGKIDAVVDISAVVWRTTDALRYTLLMPTGSYTDGVKAAMSRFEDHGMKPNELKNFWPGGDNYQGINDVYRVPVKMAPKGTMLFEVQFHTPESFKSKQDSHHFYESFRSTLDPDVKIKNWQALCEAAQQVPVPPGVLDIPNPRNNPNPGEVELYAELALRRVMHSKGSIKASVRKACKTAHKVCTSIMTSEALATTIRDIADADPDDDIGLKEAVRMVYSALTFSVVLTANSYADDAEAACDELLKAELSVEGSRNGWLPAPIERGYHERSALTPEQAAATTLPCGLGWSLHISAPGWDDGVAFTDDEHLPLTVTFHTPASLKAQGKLATYWAQYRVAVSQDDRKRILEAIRKIRASVRVPKRADKVRIHRGCVTI